MNKDNDPIMSDMKPSQDEIALRQRQLQARKAAAARSGGPSKKAPGAAPMASATNGKQTLATIALALAVVVGLLAGFLLMQLQTVQQSLENAEAVIRSQAQNIEVLNEKLSVTGENANMSVDALKSVVQEHDSEIRKLWDLSNKRNRSEIAANGKEITTLKTEAGKIKASINAQTKQITAFETQMTKADESLVKQGERLAKVEFSTKSLAEIELRMSQQSESIQALQSSITQLKKSGLGQDAADIQLKLEDINIRLDRMQNALGQ